VAWHDPAPRIVARMDGSELVEELVEAGMKRQRRRPTLAPQTEGSVPKAQVQLSQQKLERWE
jgi:hypothetical protein